MVAVLGTQVSPDENGASFRVIKMKWTLANVQNNGYKQNAAEVQGRIHWQPSILAALNLWASLPVLVRPASLSQCAHISKAKVR